MPSGHDTHHLFIQMTDPLGEDNKILLVNVSSINMETYHDETCILNAGDHPFITHPSYIRYDKARIEPVQKIEDAVQRSIFFPRGILSEAVFVRVVQGFRDSPRVARNILRFLEEDQNAID